MSAIFISIVLTELGEIQIDRSNHIINEIIRKKICKNNLKERQ